MIDRREAFTNAIAMYDYPHEEPIYSVELGGTLALTEPGRRRVVVFRPAGKESTRHKTVEAFWASALFNFVEDQTIDAAFEQLGQSGAYTALSLVETRDMLDRLIGTSASEYIAVPDNPSSCCVVYDNANLVAIVGEDRFGFFAIFAHTQERPKS